MVFKFDAGDRGTKTLVRKFWQENRKEKQNQNRQEINKECIRLYLKKRREICNTSKTPEPKTQLNRFVSQNYALQDSQSYTYAYEKSFRKEL